MNAYLLKRVLAFALVFLAIELAASLVWWALHASDRRAVAELSPRIEELSGRLGEERRWMGRRRAAGDSLDAVSTRLAAGPEEFPSRVAFDTARVRHTRRIRSWNAELAEHERRQARFDSLSAAHDRLVDVWVEAYRRAYPGWLLLPRPDPPAHVGGRPAPNGRGRP